MVTVLTPATTFTVENDFIQKVRSVNSTSALFIFSAPRMKMPEILCKTSGIPTLKESLEVELHRKLDNSRVKRVSHLPEGGAGDRLIFSREEVRVIENIEELRTEFHVSTFRNPGALDQAEIEIPEARPANGS
ncbi:MAG TPA: hypothetical protein VJ656_08350 [Pyrinomonadaceae bacterium]|nr:hypothetical protein [Pyrinomonadaceae bacterium]